MKLEILEGITQNTVDTPRLKTNYLHRPGGDKKLVLVHGNVSSSHFFQKMMLSMPEEFDIFAPDLRGFGLSETKEVDASRGVRDFSDDVYEFSKSIGLNKASYLGWSLGGGVVMQFTIDYPEMVEKLILQAPVSPYGFGGTDVNGKILNDGAGTGGGAANPEFVKAIAEQDFSDASQTSPRNILRGVYVADPTGLDHEDLWVSSMLTTATGEGNYPGNASASEHWPSFRPADKGVLNSLAPTNFDVSGIAHINPKPEILWIRGDSDAIVSDSSLFDLNHLGALGAVPGWPGAEVAPAQMMITQTRNVLDAYSANGGRYSELVLEGCGHSPHLEREAEVIAAIDKLHG